MKRRHFFFLSLISVLLLSIPFFRWGSGLLLLVAFIPLLLIEDEIYARKNYVKEHPRSRQKPGKLVPWAMLSFGFWVLLTTYWVYYATWIGIVASVIVNAGYMTLIFWLFHLTKRRLGPRLGKASLLMYWMAFEFLYIRAQVNFPWLILGYGFANDVSLIQWYEITGSLGGSLWVLLVNLSLFSLIRKWRHEGRPASFAKLKTWIRGHRALAGRSLALILLPIIFSLFRFVSYEEEGKAYEVVVLQPNIDPWLKFNDMPQAEQTDRLIRVADSLITPKTEYLVGPETFINRNMWHDQLKQHPDIQKIKAFLSAYPRAKMVIGATTLKLYRDPSEYTVSSRPLRNNQYHYDSFNSALQLDSSSYIPLYHKSRLVAGVEHMPHKEILGFLEKLTVRLGGTFRSQGTQEHREAFASPQDGTLVGPVICWESIFGEFVTEYVRDAGANFLFIITNDGWWRKTAGHRQHNAYARIRAIENRRAIARSANTGISSLINQKGEELARIGWWECSAIRGEIVKNDRLTFYTRHGDYLGRMAAYVSAILLLYTLLIHYIRKEK